MRKKIALGTLGYFDPSEANGIFCHDFVLTHYKYACYSTNRQGYRSIGMAIDPSVLKTHTLHTDPYDLIHVDPPTFPGATLPVPYNNLQLRKLDPKRRESRGK